MTGPESIQTTDKTPEKELRSRIVPGTIVRVPSLRDTPIVFVLGELNDKQFSGVTLNSNPEGKTYGGPGGLYYENVTEVLGREEDLIDAVTLQTEIYDDSKMDRTLADKLLMQYGSDLVDEKMVA